MDTNTILQGKHRGPPLGLLAVISAVLFIGGIALSSRMAGGFYVSPFAPEETILQFFRFHADAVRVQAFFLLASAVPLGIYAATVFSRLNFLGIRVAGVTIALYGGLGASFLLASSGMAQWVLSRHSIGSHGDVLFAWQDFAYVTGGPGYSSMLGLLIAGVAVPSYFMRLLPRWFCLAGVAIGICGQLSLLSLVWPSAIYFVPLTRFPGFGWLVWCGILLPSRNKSKLAQREQQP
jgi:hypothetical protein